ncbi:hypothetical protein Atc_1240 [Acidithiobacillus caldus SM-1]|uniref:Uncharacterized protein n=3 Tax=Acidithiobacillus caldus TaxID=33059 RepID=F9ZMY0_ACICS|nr:hypothetical protein Atc_1240 [Acidithiobacillus caldus SM-1]
MSVADWCAMEDNARQRNTEKHARKALRGHLREPSAAHAMTTAAQLPNGRLIKIDGHTRAWLWEHGLLTPPESVLVTVIPVSDIDEAKTLYMHFDDPRAAETLQDRLDGALREHELVLRSGCFAKLYGSSLRVAHKMVFPGRQPEIYEMVGTWKPLLLAMDGFGYGRVMASVQTVMMVGFVAYAGSPMFGGVLDFWNTFFSGAKSGITRRWLPAEALRYKLNIEKAQGAGHQAMDRWMVYTAHALDHHVHGKTYIGKNDPKGPIEDASVLLKLAEQAKSRLQSVSMLDLASMVENYLSKN